MRDGFGTKKLGFTNLKHISRLSKMDLVKGLPKICWKTHLLCEACQPGKQIKTSFKSKYIISTSSCTWIYLDQPKR